MPSAEDAEEWTATQQLLVATAATDLAEYLPGADDLEDLSLVYIDIIESTGRATASFAADWFDRLRAKSGPRGTGQRRGYRATPQPPAPRAQIDGVIRWANAPRVERASSVSADRLAELQGEAARLEESIRSARGQDAEEIADRLQSSLAEREQRRRAPTLDEVGGRLQQALQRLSMQPARATIEDASDNDTAGARWARVPQGPDTCAFCLVMASRGAVYLTEDSASEVVGRRGRTRGSRRLGDDYHDECDCVAMPFWAGDEYPEGYDPDALYDQYAVARDALGGDLALRPLLAQMREMYDLR